VRIWVKDTDINVLAKTYVRGGKYCEQDT